MPNLYIAEFQTTGGVNGGAPSGSTGALPALPWTPNSSFTVGANPNFRKLQVLQIPQGIVPRIQVDPLTDTVAINCDTGFDAQVQFSLSKGNVQVIGNTAQTVVGRQNLV